MAKIPTVIGVFLLILGVGVGVLLVNREQIFKLGASPEVSPKNVRIANITDTSFSISWVTDSATTAFVKWGETANLGKTLEDTQTASTAHLITISGLSPGRSYYFKINSNASDFDNNGLPWNTGTLTSKQTGTLTRISGSVLSKDSAPKGDVLVYVDAKDLGSFATITSSSGNWTMNIPSGKVDPKTYLLSIYAEGGSDGVATAQIYLANANPVLPIKLGQTYDLRGSTGVSNADGTIDAVISLPQDSSASAQQSRFDSSTKVTTTTSGNVTIKNITEGETVFTDKPQILGDGPKNTTITIVVHSDEELTGTVKVGSTGQWSWTPPSNLSEGEHTITVSWKDASGILRTLTRNFVIEANAAEPSFVSTPSGETPTPTTAPTATPKVTATPKPSASATPKVTATPASGSALPKAGATGISIAAMLFGSVLLVSGIYFSKKSF